MKRLCFGSFAQILRLCKLDNVSDPLLVGTMTRTVDPDCQYIHSSNATAVSRLLSCDGNLSSGPMSGGGSGAVKKSGKRLSNVIAAAQKAHKEDVVQKFREHVLGLLDEDKKERGVLALLDLIGHDPFLDGEKKLSFEKNLGTTKNALLAQDAVDLAELLAGVFLYTVAAGVVNTVGKETVQGLTPGYLQGLTNTRGIRILDHRVKDAAASPPIAQEPSSAVPPRPLDQVVAPPDDRALIDPPRLLWDQAGDLFGKLVKNEGDIVFDLTLDLTLDRSLADSLTEKYSRAEKPIFSTYLRQVKAKYSSLKTLLYNDQPKPFYDFYVCNDIERRMPAPGKHGTGHTCSIVSNITVKTLLECSRFVILAGTGGLGKSMMMRHLLLNAMEDNSHPFTIPVFIPLKDFDETVNSLFAYGFSKITSLCPDITEAQFDHVLNQGRCLILFDGLDEIGSAQVKRFERELEGFTDKYPENFFVISSRPHQSFISYSRFSVIQLMPLSKTQALTLIDRLEFRPDEPQIKEKFRTELNNRLFFTHSAFIKNPLLLTIMLLTFEQYAEVPSKMHVFYREAYAALAIKHDASKGAYRRALKTGLTADQFADYFAEFCSRSYHDEKFELTEDESAAYYEALKVREKSSDKSTTARDFLYDLCSNLCLMYFESGKYHFTHRSFQEYFCALYFSKQKDKHLEVIGDFFEKRSERMLGDKTFDMLYDMIPEKVEEYIFLPYLTRLFSLCDREDGYWTFLEQIYPRLNYDRGETYDDIYNDALSYLYNFIADKHQTEIVRCDGFPHYASLVVDEFVQSLDENGRETLIQASTVYWEYEFEYEKPDIIGYVYEFAVEDIRQKPEDYQDLLNCLADDEFILKQEYRQMREYYEQLKARQKPSGNSLFDLF